MDGGALETLDLVDYVVKAVSRGIELDGAKREAWVALSDADRAAALETAARDLLEGEGIPLGTVASWLACPPPPFSMGDPRPAIRAMLKDRRFRFDPKLDPRCIIEVTGEPCFDISINVRSKGKSYAEGDVQVFLEPELGRAGKTLSDPPSEFVAAIMNALSARYSERPPPSPPEGPTRRQMIAEVSRNLAVRRLLGRRRFVGKTSLDEARSRLWR
jgi:hypothetical protein